MFGEALDISFWKISKRKRYAKEVLYDWKRSKEKLKGLPVAGNVDLSHKGKLNLSA